MQLSNNKILITGGASGIGLALTERFIQENNTIIVCGRRASVLKDLNDKFPAVITRVCDLSVEAERIELYEWISNQHPDLNVLVNNAGIQNWMTISDPDFYMRAKEEIITNLEAPLHLTALFINLKSLNTVMNVTSGLAFAPLSKVPVYSATQSFFSLTDLSPYDTSCSLKKLVRSLKLYPPGTE